MLLKHLHMSGKISTFVPENKAYTKNGFAAYHSTKEGIAGAGNKIGFVSPERRYEAPTVARPPQM